ncbi:MAG: (Fe-S)-binding protein [Candidatus Helarchaeota archaeon]|nr:(Fe-S)-binding protein [Candidatus Helarchaeota archaeon]
MEKINLKQLEDAIYICAQCGYCNNVCATYKNNRWESASPRGKIYMMRDHIKLGNRRSKSIPADYVERFYYCLLCGRCKEVCQTNIDTLELFRSFRAWYVRNKYPIPENLQYLQKNLNSVYNPAGFDVEKRQLWLEDLDNLRVKQEADVLYFVGCTSSFYLRNTFVPKNFIKILEHANVKYTVIGADEICCGNPTLLMGDYASAKKIAEKNLEVFEKLGVSTIVASCAGCARAFTEDYPHILNMRIKPRVLHAAEYINELLDENKLQFKEMKGIYTYHDPCELGRHLKIYEPPRRILENIPGVEFRELLYNKADARCCGAGGGVKGIDNELAVNIAKGKYLEVEEVGARNLVSCCPTCKWNLFHAKKEAKAKANPVDLIELVAKALVKAE